MLTDDEPFVFFDLGSDRITNDGTSQSVAVPSGSYKFVCVAEGGEVRLEIDNDASSTSTLYIPESCIRMYPIRFNQTLSCYGSVGTFGNFRFLG